MSEPWELTEEQIRRLPKLHEERPVMGFRDYLVGVDFPDPVWVAEKAQKKLALFLEQHLDDHALNQIQGLLKWAHQPEPAPAKDQEAQ